MSIPKQVNSPSRQGAVGRPEAIPLDQRAHAVGQRLGDMLAQVNVGYMRMYTGHVDLNMNDDDAARHAMSDVFGPELKDAQVDKNHQGFISGHRALFSNNGAIVNSNVNYMPVLVDPTDGRAYVELFTQDDEKAHWYGVQTDFIASLTDEQKTNLSYQMDAGLIDNQNKSLDPDWPKPRS